VNHNDEEGKSKWSFFPRDVFKGYNGRGH
jgi:hypothetical protein